MNDHQYMKIQWHQPQILKSKNYTCGHCDQPLASEKGWFGSDTGTGRYIWSIYICHQCHKPTFIDHLDEQSPGKTHGNKVSNINDEEVEKLYEEARKCTGINSHTASILCCRKLLMHVAVAKGAEVNLSFIDYVEFLASKNYIPPDAIDWVDQIRKKGNEANHEIVIMTKEDAEELLKFSEMLLKLIYEFPANIKKNEKEEK
jgi:hypothetical protein